MAICNLQKREGKCISDIAKILGKENKENPYYYKVVIPNRTRKTKVSNARNFLIVISIFA